MRFVLVPLPVASAILRPSAAAADNYHAKCRRLRHRRAAGRGATIMGLSGADRCDRWRPNVSRHIDRAAFDQRLAVDRFSGIGGRLDFVCHRRHPHRSGRLNRRDIAW